MVKTDKIGKNLLICQFLLTSLTILTEFYIAHAYAHYLCEWDIDFSLWLCNLREFFQDVLCDFAHCFELMNHELRLLSSQALFSFLKLIEKPIFSTLVEIRAAALLLLCHMSNLTQNSTQQQHVKKTREKVTHEIFERLQNIVNYLILHLHSETMWFCTKISYFSGLITKTHRQPWNLENSILTMSGNFGFVILCMVWAFCKYSSIIILMIFGRIKVLKRV